MNVSTKSTLQDGSQPSEKFCEICLDEENSLPLVGAQSCCHAFCRPCWITWLEQYEQLQRTTLPQCPKCRAEMSTSVVEGILQRPLAPRSSPTLVVDLDEFTKTALEEMGARACPNCSVPIIKVEGCCAMQCLCGQRFCMTCLALRGCEHLTGIDAWYDNVTAQEHETLERVEQLATPAELQLNFRNFLERTRRNEESEYWQHFHTWRADLMIEEIDASWRWEAGRPFNPPGVPLRADFPENEEREKQKIRWKEDWSELELQIKQAWQRQDLVESLTFLFDNVQWQPFDLLVIDQVPTLLPSINLRNYLCRQIQESWLHDAY